MNRPPDRAGESRMVRTGGQHLRVHIRHGTGVPLVLCNGIGTSLEVLDPLVAHLGARRTVIRFDAPGTGASPTSPVPYGIPYLAWVTGRMLDTLGYGRVDMLGYSWGGALAQQFAFQNPRRCRRLVLAATATGALMVPARPAVLAKMLTPRRFVDRDYLASIAATIYGGSADFGNATVTQLVSHQLAAGSRRGYLHQLLAGAVWSSLFALPAIRQPTLIVAGTDDPIIPIINAHIMYRLMPNATLVTHPGGHVDLLTNAATLGPIIEDFLRRAPSA
ncbi:alpha/beta fold hydrolase [Rhodococcus opacus]|uniref:Poly(3-hydroxyalkanoate) depolymerase n=1 Tax=Rhodococcus opacus TaxID=37919 RepID=A0A2S8JA46_RHOOP|nr:alpha/beta fold hydrolase [Rhodococcus opacus]PQP23888.1 poly(3-hydroxyalkanoate) depolymerase [Rhodococcus opacus]